MAGSGSSAGRFPPGSGWRFLLVYVALFVPFAVTTPYLQKLLALRGFREDQIGIIQGCFEFMAVVAPPLWGYLSDRTRRPRLMLALCICGAVPVFMLFGQVQGLAAAIVVALLLGLFYRPLIPLTDAITFRFIHRFGGDYGKVRIGGSLAFISCMLLLEPLGIGRSRDASLIIHAMVAACLLHLASLWLIPAVTTPVGTPEPPHEPRLPLGRALRDICQPTFLWFTLCVFLCRFCMMSYYGFFTLYLARVHGIERAGFIWLLGPLSEIPIIYFSRPIMERIGVRNLFALGLVGVTLRLGGFSLAPGLWFIVPLQFLHSLTFGAYHCASVTYVSRIVPPRLQSTAQTLFAAITVGAGMMLGGAAGGWAARLLGFRPMYAAASILAALTLGLLVLKVPSLEHRCRPEQGSAAA